MDSELGIDSKEPLCRIWTIMDIGTDFLQRWDINILQNQLTDDASLSLRNIDSFCHSVARKTDGHQGSLHSRCTDLFLILNPETCLQQSNDRTVHCQDWMSPTWLQYFISFAEQSVSATYSVVWRGRRPQQRVQSLADGTSYTGPSPAEAGGDPVSDPLIGRRELWTGSSCRKQRRWLECLQMSIGSLKFVTFKVLGQNFNVCKYKDL